MKILILEDSKGFTKWVRFHTFPNVYLLPVFTSISVASPSTLTATTNIPSPLMFYPMGEVIQMGDEQGMVYKERHG